MTPLNETASFFKQDAQYFLSSASGEIKSAVRIQAQQGVERKIGRAGNMENDIF